MRRLRRAIRSLGRLRSRRKRSKRVVLYTQPGCVPCARAKQFLRQRGVDFEEHNIRGEADALATVMALGAASTPVIMVDDTVVFGFDERRLAAALR